MSRSWQVPGSLSSGLHTRYFCSGEVRGMEPPVGAGGKAGAAAAAKPRRLDLIDDLLARRFLPQQTLPHLVTADAAVGLERPRALELQRLEHREVHPRRVLVLQIAHFSSSRIASSRSGVRCSWNT